MKTFFVKKSAGQTCFNSFWGPLLRIKHIHIHVYQWNQQMIWIFFLSLLHQGFSLTQMIWILTIVACSICCYVVEFAEWCREGGVHEKLSWKLHLWLGPPLLPCHHTLEYNCYSFFFLFIFFLSSLSMSMVFGLATHHSYSLRRNKSFDC